MRSRIFTPANDTTLAINALRLRNDNAPLGMGTISNSLMVAATLPLMLALHDTGIVEVFEGAQLPSGATLISTITSSSFNGGDFESTIATGTGDGRSKAISFDLATFSVTSTYEDAANPLNSLANIVAKPVAPSYTVLSAINDICDRLDEIISADGAQFSKWTVLVNQRDTSIVVYLHNGLVDVTDSITPYFSGCRDYSGNYGDQPSIETLTGVIPTVNEPGVVRLGWE